MTAVPKIKVRLPTQVVTGKVTVEEYIKSLAKVFVDFSISYGVEYDDMYTLLAYAEEHHGELNR